MIKMRYTAAVRREKLYNLMHLPFVELGEHGIELSRVVE